MTARTALKSRLARALAAHALRAADPERAEWVKAMMHEQEHLPPQESTLSWALGCVLVSYRGRLWALMRLPGLLEEALLATALVLLTPPCLTFLYVALSAIRGFPLYILPSLPYTLAQARLLFGSATLIGPVGLAATFAVLCLPAYRPGRMFIVVMWALIALALSMVTWAAQYHPHPGQFLLNFVLMPALGVAMLHTLDRRRHRVEG